MNRFAIIVAAVVILPAPRPAPALGWEDLWLNDDQRGAQRMQREDYAAAAETFDDPRWRASALYRAGEYRRAADVWAGLDDTQAHYNRGNALARSGEVAAAIAAYETVLAREPGHADARHNLALLREMMQEQRRPDSSEQAAPRQPDRGRDQGDDGQSGTQRGRPGQQGEQQGDESPAPPRQADGADPPGRQAQRPPDSGLDEMPESAPQQGDGADGEAGATGRRGEPTEPPEQRAAMDQWLRRIPDDPGGLLRRKFLYQYKSRQRGDAEVDEPW